ncbi:hypothetical protein [Prochlorococcus marinus]|uniref:Uncharacterized protein n=1 Tax=Prochlorococcus marinus (strain MIT 9303) TaxID=59922 RepID=A2C963_PROM3|nr:hypothetical protein [Prochlorococcus marinus]ABM78023.1 Hypothetical protein P9303_12761 [Prochlorococcus marinus str. MIT 9303]
MEELQPTDEQLAQSMPLTLHSRWGRQGFGSMGADFRGNDYVCMCEFCLDLRRKRWLKESKNP